jgi:hypothetical protein
MNSIGSCEPVASKNFSRLFLGRAGFFLLGGCMAKEVKFFRKQADKAERMARAASDAELSRNFLNMANAYRSQAAALKAKRKSDKKQTGR